MNLGHYPHRHPAAHAWQRAIVRGGGILGPGPHRQQQRQTKNPSEAKCVALRSTLHHGWLRHHSYPLLTQRLSLTHRQAVGTRWAGKDERKILTLKGYSLQRVGLC